MGYSLIWRPYVASALALSSLFGPGIDDWEVQVLLALSPPIQVHLGGRLPYIRPLHVAPPLVLAPSELAVQEIADLYSDRSVLGTEKY